MNISQFERDKPRKTYQSLQDLKTLIQEALDFNLKNHLYDGNLFAIQEKVSQLEQHFLAGE